MKAFYTRRGFVSRLALWPLAARGVAVLRGAEAGEGWRPLPLISNGKVDPNWVHVGYGGFSVDDGALRTDCVAQGLGLLVYKKEPLGNCELKVVFKTKEARSNSGVYVRIDKDILRRAKTPGPAFERDAAGTPSPATLELVKAAAEREEGAWFAVHRGYEVQIDGSGDSWHRTGAIYSLAPATDTPAAPTREWQTMIIRLSGEQVAVQLDGRPVSQFDPTRPGLPARQQWYEPKREPKRPTAGYIGLQNHDPGDVVWFKEVSVRPLRR